MTTYQKAAGIIEKTITDNSDDPTDGLARRILDDLRDKRIGLQRLKASDELRIRFHAHTRHLGDMTGEGYDALKKRAIEHAMEVHSWPIQVVTKRLTLDSGETFDHEFVFACPTRDANTAQLMEAYSVIVDEAARRGIDLPEDTEEEIRVTTETRPTVGVTK